MNKISIAKFLTLGSYLGLILFMMLWAITLGDLPINQVAVGLILFVPPLLLPLRGILALTEKPLIWGSLVSLIYMVHGGMTMWADELNQHWGILEMTLALTYLFSSSYFVRWRAEANAQQ